MNWWLLAAGATEAVVTKEQLAPFVEDISSTIKVICMIGIGVYTILIGLELIPRMVKMFMGGGSVASDGEDYDDWPPSPEDWDWNIDPPSWLEEQWMEEGAWGDLDD